MHLQDVLEHYAPYETMVEITSADALSDTTLAAAFPLHTAAPSIKANVLDEITEDAEESTSPKRKLDTVLVPAPVPPMPGRKVSTERWPSRRTQAPQVNVDVGKSPTLSQKSSVSRFLVREESGHQSITQLDTPATSEYIPSEASIKDTASIKSGKSERNLGREISPPIALNENGELDFDKYYAELYKPKVRLGPRPVTISDRSKRTQTASVPAHSRPVSTLPAGLHTKTPSPEVVQAQFSSPPSATLSLFPRPPPIPDESAYPPRPSSRGSTRSIPLSVMSVKTSKSTMTPEKLRLMKAMELRKKQMRKSTPTETTVMSTVLEQVPVVPIVDKQSTFPEKHSDLTPEKADSCVQIGQSPVDEKTAEHHSFRQQGMDESASDHVQPDEKQPASEIQQEPRGPSFDGTLIVDQKPEITGGLERSPALTSLLGNDANHFTKLPADPSMSQSNDVGTEDHAAIPEDGTNTMNADAEGRNVALQNKRRGWVEPLTIGVNVTPNHENEQNFLSDDEFLEELHSATFQEAKPISLQRSPASPFFPPRRPSGRSAQSARSITSAISGASLASIVRRESSERTLSKEDDAAKPESAPAAESSASEVQADTSIRPVSSSSAKTFDPEHNDPIAAPRNRQVSLGISKRIQALAEKSAREGSPSLHSQSDKNSFVNMRKTTLQVPTEANSVEKRPTSKFSVWPSPSTAHTTHSNVILKQSANRDSVSVTARIVRQTAPRTEPSPAEPQQSPLPVNQSRSGQTPEFPPMAPILSSNVVPDTEESAVPEPLDRSLSPTFSYSSAEGLPTNSRKSFDRSSSAGRKKSGQDAPKVTLSKHTSTTSIASDDSQKSASRTSRFFKRISHIGGGKRKSISQSPMPSVPEPSAVESAPSTRPATRRESSARSYTTSRNNSMVRKDSVPDIPPPIVIGDLNVQFPDTLLWKRRWVEIDHLGNLIFTASRPDGGRNLQRGFVSKFNLNELKQPYVPDIDRQMMPHSVLFDLDDGATLSCSGEDSMAQRQLLSCRS